MRAQPADLIIENAHIYTNNPLQPVVKAIAVRGGRIVYVGDDASTQRGKRRIDLQGATVVPGFIDSHGHMAGLGELLQSLNLRHVKSVAAITEMVRKSAMSQPKGAWIRGRAWDQTDWGGQFPDRQSLDKATPDHPVYLSRVDGHAAWVNSRALEMADINAATPDPAGGQILRDSSGKPTGILIDKAQSLVASKIPARTADQTEQAIRLAARECVKFGLTGVHDAGIGPSEVQAYRRLTLPLRIYAMLSGAENLPEHPEIGERLTIRSIKLMADGAMGSRGAAFLQPYSDDPGNRGLLMLTRERIEQIAREAAARGFQVNTHAIGDRANRTVLEAYAAVLKGKNDKRFRIEHAQVVSPEDVKLYADNSVIASIQSTHATSDMRWAEDRLGPARLAGAWMAQTFLQSGVAIANGSDFPVEEANPLLGFYAAVTRQDPAGNPPGGFLPKERLTREQALRSWTLGGAYAAFEERDKGSLEPGKFADFVVLSRDIMTAPPADILKAQVRMTVVGGEIVYQAQ